MLAADQVVHSLTIDGQEIPAGVYTQDDFPNYILASGTYTLTVLTPDTPPTPITDLAAGGPQTAFDHPDLVRAARRNGHRQHRSQL